MKHYSRKKNSPAKLLFALTIILAGLFVASKQLYHEAKNVNREDILVAEYGEEKIYKSDIEKKINEMFEVSTISGPMAKFESLSDSIVEFLSKEIYLDRKILKKSIESGIDKNQRIVNRLESYRTAITRQLYVDTNIKIDEQEIIELYNKKYVNKELKKEYRLTQITFLDKAQAEKIRKLIKKNNFDEIVKKYSVRQVGVERNGDSGYVNEDILIPDIKNLVVGMKIGEVSNPIFLNKEWVIYKLVDKINQRVPPYEEVKSDIRAEIYRNKYDQMMRHLADGTKYNLIVRPKNNPIITKAEPVSELKSEVKIEQNNQDDAADNEAR